MLVSALWVANHAPYSIGQSRMAFSWSPDFSHPSPSGGGKRPKFQTALADLAGIAAGESGAAAGELEGTRGAG